MLLLGSLLWPQLVIFYFSHACWWWAFYLHKVSSSQRLHAGDLSMIFRLSITVVFHIHVGHQVASEECYKWQIRWHIWSIRRHCRNLHSYIVFHIIMNHKMTSEECYKVQMRWQIRATRWHCGNHKSDITDGINNLEGCSINVEHVYNMQSQTAQKKTYFLLWFQIIQFRVWFGK